MTGGFFFLDAKPLQTIIQTCKYDSTKFLIIHLEKKRLPIVWDGAISSKILLANASCRMNGAAYCATKSDIANIFEMRHQNWF